MSKVFQKGLVVGKFSPLHRGHELVIRRALEMCAEVFIISYSKPEFMGCEAVQREKWLSELFPQTRRLVVTGKDIAKLGSEEFAEVPPNDAPDSIHRRFVGFLCLQVLRTTMDVVFTSESYGDGFAGELTAYFSEHGKISAPVRHVLIDLQRISVPISGTELRSDAFGRKQWLSPCVYASFVKRVCFLGGESSGKSTLAQAMACHFQSVSVPEYGRELWEKKQGRLNFEDMLHIAERQVDLEECAARNANNFLFCDTSPLTTLFYSQHLFGRADSGLIELTKRSYEFLFLCAADFDFVQDGTRQTSDFRMKQHQWYESELKERGVPYRVVTGTIEQRVQQVAKVLKGE